MYLFNPITEKCRKHFSKTIRSSLIALGLLQRILHNLDKSCSDGETARSLKNK